ncbi:Protoheme IX farnesyltransferase [Candidatus Erwinia haradaeae]|uniref:Protoheme IX farnesyltransferase n=1 Tax=Candidatus Erwinia haradaeae TaxID=1922217 RepID=A0A451CZR2_9GAMM|nr:heme o synthase [Candidatus Erwinia haradaeae]VFP78899.1 Protoheme IX farnesyltransferase [Candidatus Erwinia haradaeae]
MIKHYLQLTKPGIIAGNLIALIGGFLLASKYKIDYYHFFFTIIGTILIIASSCVYNNYIDRDIDKKAERTKNRILSSTLISLRTVLVYATILGVSGFIILLYGTNPLATLFATIGFIIYVGVYSLYMKRHSIYGTLIGSLSGSTPPLIGYCSASGKFDSAALILLSIFSLWQIPHSYAISILYLKDYQITNIPVLPVKLGIIEAKKHIIIYIIAFISSTMMLFIAGYTGYKYLIVMSTVGIWWLSVAVIGYRTYNSPLWAKKIFLLSLVVITAFSIMISIDIT